ncbi:MAG: DUF401 family protein [Romboutsia sp.]
MDIYKLCLVFIVIIIILSLKKPLYLAIIGGLVTSIIAYKIPILESINIMFKATISPSTINVVLSFYFITFLQRMLEKRHRLKEAQESLNGIFNNRRINASLAPAVIGLLPSAGALPICGKMVDDACEGYISKEDKTFITSFFRHIPESFLPTYSSILIAITLSGVNTGDFVLAMIPMVIVLFILGYIFYLRKIPKETNVKPSENKKSEIIKLVKSIWSIGLIVFIILIFDIPVYIATPIVVLINYCIDKFKIKEVSPMFKSAFEIVIISNTVLVMVFKDIITYTGVINQLPDFFGQLPIPISLVFALIFFFGTIVSGGNAIISLCMPMAMVSVPDAGVPLVVLLMCFSYAAMQVSPTHVCLFIATEYFNTGILDLIKRTIPLILVFSTIVILYTQFLKMLF